MRVIAAKRIAAVLRAALLAIALGLLPMAALADSERIDNFDANIVINADGSLDVTETIAVTALGQEIKRGIVRHIPLRYSDGSGNTFVVGFELSGVQRDGEPEDSHTETAGDGIDIYLGSADRFISKGPHVYEIRYHTTYQLGHFADHDELYWNVTGTEWDMPIRHASATVTLPAVVAPEQLQARGFTGPYGSKAQDLSWQSVSSSQLRFETTKPLGPREGLTIVVGFPGGLVVEPPPTEANWENGLDPGSTELYDPAAALAARRERINRTEGVALILLGILIGGYFLLWNRIGRDPLPGRIYMQAEPPDNLSPAAMRYLIRRGNTDKSLALVLMNLAQKGAISISEAKDGDYTLAVASESAEGLAPEEAEAFKALFSKSKTLEVKQASHARFSAAQSKVDSLLAAQFGKGYYNNNEGASCLGCLGGLILLGICAVVYGSADFGFASVLLFFCGLGMIATVIIFSQLMPSYTKRGRELLDRIEGFKLWLTGGDPAMPFAATPEQLALFGERLPYALALDVQSTWTALFTKALEEAQKAQGAAPMPADGSYVNQGWYSPLRPRWYNYYGSTPFDPYRFSDRFYTHFPNRVAQARVDPTPSSSSSSSSSGFRGGGSSGFSGGGSSGGGRGGGGGRGW